MTSAGHLHYTHERSMNIIYACITLHNFLIENNYAVDDELDIIIEDVPTRPFQSRADDGNESRIYLANYVQENLTTIEALLRRRTW